MFINLNTKIDKCCMQHVVLKWICGYLCSTVFKNQYKKNQYT